MDKRRYKINALVCNLYSNIFTASYRTIALLARRWGDDFKMKLTREEKAEILLEHLDKYLQVNWNFEEYYLKAIKSGLQEIEEKESKKAD